MSDASRPRVLLDSNVLASGFYAPAGTPGKLVDLHAAGLIQLCLSQRVVNETLSTIRNKMPRSALARYFAFIEEESLVLFTDPDDTGHVSSINLKDRPIVAAAIEGDVDYFVTGDRALLKECRALKLKRPRFVSPRELVDLIEPRS